MEQTRLVTSHLVQLSQAMLARMLCITLLGAGTTIYGPALHYVPQLALIGFGLAGIAFSVVFPTMLAWAARRHPEIRADGERFHRLGANHHALSIVFPPSIWTWRIHLARRTECA